MHKLTELIRMLIRPGKTAEDSSPDGSNFEEDLESDAVSEARDCAPSRDEKVWRRSYSRF